MRKALTLAVLLLTLFAGACQPAATVLPATSTPAAATSTPDLVLPSTKLPLEGGTPMPTSPTQPSIQGKPTSDYPPLPGDSALERGQFFLDAVTLMPVTGQPGQYRLAVEGSLPTPCHQLRVLVNAPDELNTILVDVYSVVDPGKICTQVLKPFAGFVATLGSYASGRYSVAVNDQPPAAIDVP